jgi:hypothetical protein
MPALRCYRRTVESHVDAAKFKRELKSSSEMRDFIKAQKALAEWILTELEKEHKAEEKTKRSEIDYLFALE